MDPPLALHLGGAASLVRGCTMRHRALRHTRAHTGTHARTHAHTRANARTHTHWRPAPRRSLEANTTKDDLQAQARHHFGIAMQQLALAAASMGQQPEGQQISAPVPPAAPDLACCQQIQPFLPIVEAVKANCSPPHWEASGTSARGHGPGGRRMAIVSPVLPLSLAAYVLERCGLQDAVGLLAPTWEQGIMHTAGRAPLNGMGSSSSGCSGDGSSASMRLSPTRPEGEGAHQRRGGGPSECGGVEAEQPARVQECCAPSVAHLFTPNLAHAQRMARELGEGAVGPGWPPSMPSVLTSGEGVTNPSALSRDALEHAFSLGCSLGSEVGARGPGETGAGRGAGEHSEQGRPLWGEHGIHLEVHLAEWACTSQPSRAKAIGQEGLHLTDEIKLAELAGCLSRAVLDGVEWQ